MPLPRRLALPFVGLAATLAAVSVLGRREAPPDPELVTLAATPDRDAVPAGEASTIVVRIELAAAQRSEDAEVGVNLGLVLDTSGSMAGEPIEQARAAVHTLVDQLRPNDRLTLVTFDSRAQLLLPPTAMDDVDLEALHRRIDEIHAEGTTDLAGGLGTMIAQLDASPTVGDLDRIVLVGDGVPNDARPIAGQVEAARRSGYAITTLGVGLDYDEVLLGAMARDSGGRFHHIEDGAAMAQTFTDEVLGAQRQVAANVWLQLSTGPGVTIAQVVGHGGPMVGVHQHTVMLAELTEGESQDVFVELAIDAPKPGSTLELLDAIVAYDDRAGTGRRLERRAFVSMPTSGDVAVLAMRSSEVELGMVAARAASATIDAIVLAREGDLDGADALLSANESALRDSLATDGDHGNGVGRHVMAKQQDEIIRLRNEVKNFHAPKAAGLADDGRIDTDAEYRRVAKEANAAAYEVLQGRR